MAKIAKNATFIKALEKKFNSGENSIHVFDREGVKGQVIISAEDGDMIDNWPVGDYYDAPFFDPKEEHHEMGINKKLIKWCNTRGWRLEWETAGSIIAYKDF